MKTFRSLYVLAAALLGVLLLAVVWPAYAQTIENTAHASYVAAGTTLTVDSNMVAIEVSQPQVSIRTFRPLAGSATTTLLSPSFCNGVALPVFNVPGVSGSSAAVEQSASLTPGENLIFRVTAPIANLDDTIIDTIRVRLGTTAGDREELVVYETAPGSGIFAGAIPTAAIPPQPVQNDCRLSSADGDVITIEYPINSGQQPIATATVNVLADPFGIVFDSQDGRPVSGATVTLVDASGQPAAVFADDGVTSWPSTVISGRPITDGAGNVHIMPPGEYRFPLVALGTYRVVVTPPAPYTAPSVAARPALAALVRPDGRPFTIADASFGGNVTLTSPAPVRVDVPVDRPNITVALSKTVSKPRALPGDVVFYTVRIANQDTIGAKRDVSIVDTPSEWLRLRRDSIRIDGAPVADGAAANSLVVSPDGRMITIRFAEIAAGAVHTVSYAMAVRADAPQGQALNRAEATDQHGDVVAASAVVMIDAETIGNRMTLIGRITEGACTIEPGTAEQERRGIAGVRVVLEDGSFAITDGDGRYHFEGLLPGTHVVQAQRQTLPQGGAFADCSRSTANAGSPDSRFVRGQGGSLLVADFEAVLPESWAPEAVQAQGSPEDGQREGAAAAGAETDFLALGDGPTDFLFPQADHNPRAPAVRVVIRHEPSEHVELTANGEAVNPLSFDGARTAPGGAFAISTWRGIPLEAEATQLVARVIRADGSMVTQLERVVHYSGAPALAQLLGEQSRLVADGSTRPVIAVRITDRHGRPARAGISGQVSINAPYESARVLDNMQQRQVSGIGDSAPTWTIAGDDGIALIELAPTMVSGPLHLAFTFADGEISRRQEMESWIVPGEQEWTLVGLVEGSAGARSIADNMERSGHIDSDLGRDARAAFYAKGRVLGRFLLTAAYDSASQAGDERLTGAIDPNAYYTVFADGAVRQFDAASREKLYVRIETATFYAIYGDIQTGFDQTELARYNRAATGVRAEGRFGDVHVQGFAAETQTRFRRDEIQGSGLSGPYALSSRAIVANSERVTIEVRDRFRSESIVDSRTLERFVDYDIDLLSGTITFNRPVLSRDGDFNPQFIVIEYEIDTLASAGEWNAGARADVTLAGGTVRLGATLITDKGDADRTNIVAADARVRLGAATELRAEVAASRTAGDTAAAWQVEAEHHDGNLDLLAYARSQDATYGVGQQNGGERGRRKLGADARYAFSEDLSLITSAWRDDSLTDAARRTAMQGQLAWRHDATDLSLGLAHFADRRTDGTTGSSTVLEGGVTQRLLDNRLELFGATSVALGGTDSIDLPTRHRLGARYGITSDVNLVGSYEIASGDAIDARTLRGGIEVNPWSGGHITTSLGQQTISEFGQRSFAAFGLAQSLALTPELTIDATIDGNRQLGGVSAATIINPDQPVASGGHLGQGGELFEDFTSATLGASWRQDRWALTGRAEWRDGQFANRTGITAGAIRQLGEGSMVGAGFSWTRAQAVNGAATQVLDGAISAAHRPDASDLAFLAKLEYRSDMVTGAVAGAPGPAGSTALNVTGDAQSRRLLASLSTNWSPEGFDEDDGGLYHRSEVSLFVGGRYGFDSYENFNVEGFALLAGLDGRIGIGERFELGGRATLRSNLTDGVSSFAAGPEMGFVPTEDLLLTLGYNITGFRDQDFSAARYTDSGVFAGLRLKLDADSFSFISRGN